jgi:hypothetical protein
LCFFLFFILALFGCQFSTSPPPLPHPPIFFIIFLKEERKNPENKPREKQKKNKERNKRRKQTTGEAPIVWSLVFLSFEVSGLRCKVFLDAWFLFFSCVEEDLI